MADRDLDLLARWQAGDARAGNELVGRHFPGVRAYFVNKTTLEYEDLVQETFARLVKGRDRFRGDASFKTYLYSIARYVFLEHVRRRFRPGRDVDPLEDSIADMAERRGSSIAAAREHHRILLDALRELALADQELLELHYWQGLSTPELCQLFELGDSTMRSRVRAAIKRLRQRYAELCAKPHDWGADAPFEDWLGELRELAYGG